MAELDAQSTASRESRSSVLRSLLYPALALRRAWHEWRYAPRLQMMETLGRLLAEDPVVRVDGLPGRFAIGPESDILRRVLVSGSYEPQLMQVCRQYADPVRDAIDVGANIGFYSVLLADHLRGRRVLAIEPTPAALQRLRRNLSINGCEATVTVFAGAAGAANGTVSISTVPGREEYSTAGTLAHPSVSGAVVKTLQIAAQTVDSLVAQYALDPGFVKIDVEGMEHVVLAGMRSTIEKFKPVILAELSDPLLKRNGSSSRQVLQQISALGYSVSDPLFPGMSAGARSYGDVLCVPHR